MVKLNKDEFNEMIFTRINNLIQDYELIKKGELIAIALSGGKDSVLTLHALKNYQQFLDFDLVAVSVDEGIEGYRQHGIDSAVQNAKDLGVMATIENMPNFDTMIYQDIHALNELLEEYEMYMTLDIGHANHAGYSADEIIFDSIKHVHAHDNFGDDDSHLPLGEGNIKLNDIINSLESKNYKGIYILEVNDFDSIKKSYEYMKKNF